MPKLELSTQQKAELLYKSKTQKRSEQKQYLESLGGDGSAGELDSILSLACHDADAMRLASALHQKWIESLPSEVESIRYEVSQAVSFFLHSLIAGDFGPDDSRDGRSAVFLRDPYVVARTTEIFIQRLLIDRDGMVTNHDEAEKHAVDYLQDQLP
ncbi:hypothetical protein [Stieleria varia]|uniref:Uncharacterized protein n=1 Tax=Stieleria varia TaxID=2528005 RepID=A0A5C6AUZ6_9BACT|nr:hypothetical protein [Stieleria varia]TWU02896.1 hypothetical protein Pla52n_39840 [Stieleria varia]